MLPLDLFTTSFAFLGSVFLGLSTYLRNPKSWTNRLFILFTLVLSIYSIINYLSLHQGSDYETFMWVKWTMSLVPYLNLLYFLLVVTFPKPNFVIKPHIIFIYIFLTFVLTPFAQLNLIFTSVVSSGANYTSIPGPGMAFFLLHTLFFLGGGFLILINKFRKSIGVEKTQVKFFLIGTVVMYSAIVFTNLIFVLLFNVTALIQLLPLYMFIFVGFVSYAIVKHKFLDISLLVARTVSYTVIIFVVVAGYILLLYTLTSVIPELAVTTKQLLAFSAISLVLFFTSNTLRRIVEQITDSIFFKGRYDPEKLLSNLTHTMAEEIDIESLSKKLLSTLNQQMRLVKSAFIVINKDSKQMQIVEDRSGKGYALTNDELEKLRLGGEILIFEELGEGELKMILRKLEISILMPLKSGENNVGFLLLGPKASGDIYTGGDIDVLKIFAPEAAIALQNALAYLEIQEFSRTLEKKVIERTRELKQSQESELAKAKELLKLKDEFVFIATHDLKTPVTAINGFMELIKETKQEFSEENKESLKAIQESSDRLKQLTNDLLQVARSDSGTIEVSVVKVDLVDLIQKSIQQVTPAATEKNITINHNLDQNNKFVMADEARLHEVVENLLSNAVKYNKPAGRVDVTSTAQNGEIKVDVADTGYGIPKEAQEKVFEKFFRARQKGTEGVAGTGLGLFVVRMLVEKMGGRITFESVEAKGTTFTFYLKQAS